MTRSVGLIPKAYNPSELEARVFAFWKERKIYEKAKQAAEGKPRFYFLDGPPFPSSEIPHLGTAWNKILKDIVIRYKRAQGYNVRDQPGYDCHGLPIELAVENKHGFKTKKEIIDYGLDKFVGECKQLAQSNAQAMNSQFQNLGVWMDWDRTYLTHNDSYVESVWWTVKRAYEKGLFQHDMRIVHWCPRCETTLSEYEVVMEYRVLRDPSIYVKFPVKGKTKEFIVIWTTTPWTLPSNTGVMVHPEVGYVKVRCEDENYIIARPRLEAIAAETGKQFEILETLSGMQLEGLEYDSPLSAAVPAQQNLQGGRRVITSTEYVTMEEGTGCVHTAPGHGEEDYEVGLRNHLPILMLVDERGAFVAEAGKYAGKSVRDANQEIVDDLKNSGYLLHEGTVDHRFPLCWRCRTPLLLRGTKQWVITVTRVKDEVLNESGKSKWIPDWAGSVQFRNWLQGLRDWVISRQRFWGTPLPVWQCKACDRLEVIGSREELLTKARLRPRNLELHRPWVDQVTIPCSCGSEMHRVPDIMVGWFDAGASSYACLDYPKTDGEISLWPADFIVEGRDQISGWFFSLLKSGMVAMGGCSYRTVLMHGFMLDDQAREMHKSLGNFVTPVEAVERHGRDPLRYYLLQNTTWEDAKFSWKGLQQVFNDLVTVWNVFVFASTYMNLDVFDPSEHPLQEMRQHMKPEDRWLMSRTNQVVRDITGFMNGYRIHDAARLLKTFLIEDLSHNYVRLVRRRTWMEKESPEKSSAYAVLYYSLKTALLLAAPIMPMLAEELYQSMFKPAQPDLPESIHMHPWPEVDETWLDEKLHELALQAQGIVSAVAAARMKAGLKLRQPVRQATIVTDNPAVESAVQELEESLLEQANTKKIAVKPSSGRQSLIELNAKPNLRAIGPEFREKANSVATKLQTLPKTKTSQLIREGMISLKLNGDTVTITKDHVTIEEAPKKGLVRAVFDGGELFLDTHLTEKELAEGLARDVVRRIQQMRKEMDLDVASYVEAFIVPPDRESRELLDKKKSYIATEVRAKRLHLADSRPDKVKATLVKEWEIADETYVIGVTPLKESQDSSEHGQKRARPAH